MLRGSVDFPAEVVRARLYVTAHGLYVAYAQRAPGGRGRPRPRLDRATSTGCATRPTTSPSSSRPGDQRAGRSCSATAGTAAGSASSGDRAIVRRPARPPGAARDHDRRRRRARARHRRARGPRTESGDPRRRPLRRAAHRPAPAAPTQHGHRRSTSSTPTCAAWSPPDGPPVRVTEVLPARRGLVLAVRSHAGGLRPERRRLGAAARPRCGGRDRGRRPPRRGARARRARRRGPCARPRRPTPTCSPADDERGAGAAASRSTASATPRSPAWPDLRRRRRRGRRRRLATCAARAGSAPRTPLLEPLPRERRVGHARQLPRRADRLPAARRAARVDRRHPGLRAHRHLPVRQRRLPHLVAGRPGRRAAAGRVGPVRHPRRARTTPSPAAAAWGDAATIVPWVLYQRTGDRGLLERQLPEHARLGRPDGRARRARTGSGPAASSSATGSTRPRRRTSRAAAKADPDVVATAHLARSADVVARGRASARRRRRRRRALRRPRGRGPRGVRPRVRHPGGRVAQRRADGLRAGARVGPAADGRAAAAAGQRLADLVRVCGLPHQHRLRRHARSITDALCSAGDARRRLPAAAADAAARRGSTP